jgi:ATP phosphoribosyltransferase regulatory subunit
MTDTHPALLPNGLMDLLPDEAEAEAQALATLMSVFSSFGYRRVKPPLVEFEDSLLAAGPGAAMTRQTFRLMDPVSQRMMGVRADTTAQIARIASSRLPKEKRPLRLSYAADVLRVNGTQLRPARQFTQAGCELIGATTPRDDAEIMLMALCALDAIGIKDVSIDVTAPALVGNILSAFPVSAEIAENIQAVLKRRDVEALKALGQPAGTPLAALMAASGKAEGAMSAIEKIDVPAAAARDVAGLMAAVRDLMAGVKVYGLPVNITIDLIEHRGLDYETGIGFTLFAPSVRGELGGGGRYRPNAGSEDMATGFTLYMDSLLPGLTKTARPDIVCLPVTASWEEIKKRQQTSERVTRG